jgi:hypothetical protein
MDDFPFASVALPSKLIIASHKPREGQNDTGRDESHQRRPATHGRATRAVFPARPDQVREARRFLATVLNGCPAADDAILCLSELAANSVLHSDSRKAGGTFTVRAEVHERDYVWIEVEDNGGPWDKRAHRDGRPHGLAIVNEVAAAWGIDGDQLTGWVVWAILDWPPSGPPHAASRDAATAPASDAAQHYQSPAQRSSGDA